MGIVRNLIVVCGLGGDESAIILQGYGPMLYPITVNVEYEWMSSGVGVSVVVPVVPAKVKPIEKWWYDYPIRLERNPKVISSITFDFSEAKEIEASISEDFEETKLIKSLIGKDFTETKPIRAIIGKKFQETLPTIGAIIKGFEEIVPLVTSTVAIQFSKPQRITGRTISTYEDIQAEVEWEEEKLEIERHNL